MRAGIGRFLFAGSILPISSPAHNAEDGSRFVCGSGEDCTEAQARTDGGRGIARKWTREGCQKGFQRKFASLPVLAVEWGARRQ
jgi:hypothetical protein